MPRVSWKVPFISNFLFSKPFINLEYLPPDLFKIKPKIRNRNSVINKLFIGKRFRIFNGKTFITLNVNSDMIGHRFGEFSVTKRLGHRGEIVLRKKKNYRKKQ